MNGSTVRNRDGADPIRQSVPTPKASVDRRGSRRSGAAVALFISAAVAVVTVPLFDSFFAHGIPAATLLGWLLGPAIGTDDWIGGPVAVMALLSVPLAEVVLLASVSPPISLEATLITGFFGLTTIGYAMLAVTTPCAIAWGLIVRRRARSRAEAV